MQATYFLQGNEQMKISKQYLQQIIKEEFDQVMKDSSCAENSLEEAEYQPSQPIVKAMNRTMAAAYIAVALAAGYKILSAPSEMEQVQMLSDRIINQYPEIVKSTVANDGYDGATLMQGAIEYAKQKAGSDQAFLNMDKRRRAALIEEFLEMKRRERQTQSDKDYERQMQQRVRPYRGL